MNAETFICFDCKKTFPVQKSGGTGYATLPDGQCICYGCSDKRQIEQLKDRTKPFFAYVSSNGRTITSWPGGKLMDIIASSPCRLTRPSFTHDSRSYRSIRAKDVHGGEWAGRGSAGIAIKLRPVK